MKAVFGSIWFWLAALIAFLVIILYDSDLDKEAISKYVKGKMKLSDVHFSEMDKAFEAARIFADEVEMDDTQTNMVASRVRALFFDREVATRTAEVVASMAYKSAYEIKFVGDVRMHTSDNERLRSDEMRYFVSRHEIYTSCPVTLWKDDLVLTGREMQFNTETRQGTIKRDIVIRIWRPASDTARAEGVSTSAAPPLPDSAIASGAASSAAGRTDTRSLRALAPLVQVMLRTVGVPGIMAGRSDSIRSLLAMAENFSGFSGVSGVPGLQNIPGGVRTIPAVVPGFDAAGKFLQGLGNLTRPGLPSGAPALASAATLPELKNTGIAATAGLAASMAIPAPGPGRKPAEEFPPRVPEEWLLHKNDVASAPSGGDK